MRNFVIFMQIVPVTAEKTYQDKKANSNNMIYLRLFHLQLTISAQ